MFLQLVSPHPNALPTPSVIDNIKSLFTYHPLQMSALVETVWLNRYHADPASSQISSPFLPWSPQIAYNILNAPFFPGYIWPKGGGPPTALLAPALAAVQKPPLGSSPNYIPPLLQPGIDGTWDGTMNGLQPVFKQSFHATNWDHLIYAYVIENTRIYEIFCKVLLKYMNGGELETPSHTSQLFWRNLEFLIFGDAMPSMV